MRIYTEKFEIALGLVLFFLFLLLAFAVKVGSSSLEQIDNTILQTVQSLSNPILTWIMVSVSTFGDGFNSVLIFFAFALALLIGGYKKQSYFSFVVLVGVGISFLTKMIVARQRPEGFLLPEYSPPSDFGFPSGHVTFYTVFFGLVAIYALTLPRISKIGRVILLAISGSLISLVGLSRVYLGVHYPTDVVGGYLLGFAILVLVNLAFFRFIFRRDEGQTGLTPR